MSRPIADIEGIGPVYQEKLGQGGITTVEGLLEKGATRNGRSEIADSCGLDEGQILKWVNMADLYRVKGIGSEYAELLEAAGVDTVKELRHRSPENLHAKMQQVNEEKKLVRQLPSAKQVELFVNEAKKLDPKVTY
jgi:predicted flap endonuclease-1-like 5' DNA nuclease